MIIDELIVVFACIYIVSLKTLYLHRDLLPPAQKMKPTPKVVSSYVYLKIPVVPQIRYDRILNRTLAAEEHKDFISLSPYVRIFNWKRYRSTYFMISFS